MTLEVALDNISSKSAIMLCGCEGELSREYISRKYFTFRTVCVKTIDISSEGETVVPKRIVSINK